MNRGNGVTRTLHKACLPWLALLLIALAMPAFALGLGQITVKSQRGEPLLAEIAIVSNDPGELENLQVRLASPETFARVGLEPPGGTVTGLQFRVALDPQGRPVIRVTSAAPVDESLLTFLLEVDWGQGRLVREYSALLDAPRTVSAPAQPPIEAPVAAPGNAIVREPVAPAPAPAPEPPPAAAPTPQTAQPAAQPATPVATEQASEAPAPGNAIEPTAVPVPTPAAQSAPRAQPVAATPGEYGPVRMGDTLGKIARSVDPDGHSLDQVMLALLRANPDAFIQGNVNLIKAGAVLRVPGSSELSQYSAREARAIVHEQIGQWREMRKPATQPAAVAAGDAAEADGAPAAAGSAARTADARLEIVPPSSKDARQAGTRSGTQAGGEGDMLQELQQTKETLAARDAEVQDLKTQVAELEKLRQDQQQLIALKDSKLAETQQALAARQAEAATQAPSTATAQGGTPVWPWALGALLVVALLAWLLMRGKAPAPKRPAFDTSRLAAGIPSPVVTKRPEAAVVPAAPAPLEAAGSPTWHAGAATPAAAAPKPPPAVDPAPAPVRTPAPPAPAAAAPVDAAVDEDEPAAVGHDRIELARAYIELGDVDTARGLLQEVADGGDAAARGEAARLLRELV
ncbi:hypothetical protein GCM10027564_02570 [Luteimonas notoginsengisoli]|uniref:FimV/HubP family polar landmark protein n=1 Tax=Luteimonas notoginsengisoli TaxID=1578200 RepID=A0ABV7USB4_9GAMM